MTSSPDDVPGHLRRRWSRALRGAGLVEEALRIHPATSADDARLRAELAVLALDPATAQRELKALDDGSEREPWVRLLTRAAAVLAGETDELTGLTEAAAAAGVEPRVFWVYALAAQSVKALVPAGRAAARARHGGVRDPRLLSIEAAGAMSGSADLDRALDLTRRAQKVALADENLIAYTADLLVRSGHRDAAAVLATTGVARKDLPHACREAWHEVARSLGAAGWRGPGAMGRHERALRRRRDEAARDLVCRCWGSTGWLGPARLHYVDHHLHEVVDTSVAGLDARLLRCPATATVFLDFPARGITLPVSVGG